MSNICTLADLRRRGNQRFEQSDPTAMAQVIGLEVQKSKKCTAQSELALKKLNKVSVILDKWESGSNNRAERRVINIGNDVRISNTNNKTISNTTIIFISILSFVSIFFLALLIRW